MNPGYIVPATAPPTLPPAALTTPIPAPPALHPLRPFLSTLLLITLSIILALLDETSTAPSSPTVAHIPVPQTIRSTNLLNKKTKIGAVDIHETHNQQRE